MSRRAGYEKEYYQKNKVQLGANQAIRRHTYRQKLINDFGGKCVKCGFSDWRALQFDHVNGNGSTMNKKLGSYRNKYIRKHPKQYQLLCANCNWIKRFERHEYGNKKL